MPCVDGHRGYREAAQPSASRAGRQAKWRWAATDNLLAAAREAADSDRALMAAFLLSLVRASAGAHRRPAGVRRAHKRAIRQNFGLLADSTALAWRGARGACRGYSQAPCCPTAGVAARLPAETWCGRESAAHWAARMEDVAADPQLWLEDVLGERALAWVEERNAETCRSLEAEPGFEALRRRLLAIYDSK